MAVEIAAFHPSYTTRFAELNREWLERYHLMEPSDEAQLADPQASFLDRGGQIFVALHDANVVGTCAIVPYTADTFEIAKLAVSPEFRGQGIARQLVERCLAYAREHRACRVTLVSNSQLRAALRLYESLGFSYQPAPEIREYETADVYMALDLDSTGSAR